MYICSSFRCLLQKLFQLLNKVVPFFNQKYYHFERYYGGGGGAVA